MYVFLTQCREWPTREQLEKHITWLPQALQQDILAFQKIEDATRTYLGKELVRYGFARLGIPFSWDRVCYSDKGRPILQDKDMDFNISHSGEYIIAAIGRHRVGVDIERHRKVNPYVFNRQFHPEETEIIQSSVQPVQQFFDFWTIKEAAIKADGRGVAVLSKTFITSVNTVLVENITWYYRSLNRFAGYSATVVTPFELKENDMEYIEVDGLFSLDQLKG